MSGNGITPPSGSWGGNLRVDADSIAGTTIDYNLFYREDATVQIIWNNINYTSLAAFRAAVPAQEVHGLEGNPLFVDPVASVLRQTGVPYSRPRNFRQLLPERRIAGDRQRQRGCSQRTTLRYRRQQPHR